MPQAFICIDAEFTGQTSGRQYSMISIGARIIGKPQCQFYCEIQPISEKYTFEAMKIASQGLLCLQNLKKPAYDPFSKDFKPQEVLEALERFGESPMSAMAEFRHWVLLESQSKNINFVTERPSLDWAFACQYFQLAGERNPFARCLDSSELINNTGLYKGMPVDTSMLDIPDNRKPPHNALQDAILNAEIIEKVFEHNRHLCQLLQAA